MLFSLLARRRSRWLTWSSDVRILTQAMCSPIKFRSLILVEPMLDVRPGSDYDQLRTRLVRSAYKRKDVWNSREEAADYFRNAVR